MEKSWMPITSGILSIICGAVNALMGFTLIIMGTFASTFMPMMNIYSTGAGRYAFGIFMVFIGIFIIITGALAIAGGIFALRKRIWGLALAGAIASFFSWTWTLGIASIVIIALARDQFHKVL